MHSSDIHKKMETMIREAKDLLAHTDTMLTQSKKEHEAIRQEVAVRSQEARQADEKLDGEIRAELAALTKTADDYINSLEP